MAFTDLAVELRLRHESCHRVDDDDVNRVRLDEHLGDLQGLFTVARLADEQLFEVHAEPLRPGGVEGVFGVDKRRNSARLLGIGDGVQRESRLTARLRSEELDHAAAGTAHAAEGEVEGEGSRRDPVDDLGAGIGQPHDRSLAKRLGDLTKGVVEHLLMRRLRTIRGGLAG